MFYRFRTYQLYLNYLQQSMTTCQKVSKAARSFKFRTLLNISNYWSDYHYTLDPEDVLHRWTSEQPTGLIGLKSRAVDKGKSKGTTLTASAVCLTCARSLKLSEIGEKFPEMFNNAKILRPRPRPRPELWGRGRGLSFEVKAEARTKRSRPRPRKKTKLSK